MRTKDEQQSASEPARARPSVVFRTLSRISMARWRPSLNASIAPGLSPLAGSARGFASARNLPAREIRSACLRVDRAPPATIPSRILHLAPLPRPPPLRLMPATTAMPLVRATHPPSRRPLTRIRSGIPITSPMDSESARDRAKSPVRRRQRAELPRGRRYPTPIAAVDFRGRPRHGSRNSRVERHARPGFASAVVARAGAGSTGAIRIRAPRTAAR